MRADIEMQLPLMPLMLWLAVGLLLNLSVAAATQRCRMPSEGAPFVVVTPEAVGLDSIALRKAVQYSNTHNRLSLQIFRRGCLVDTGVFTAVTDSIPNNIWSCTKSVISMLVGIAQSEKKLSIQDEIDRYLPNKPGWGDKKHRRLTILDLLTETAGMRQAILSEAATVGVEASAPQEALAQPFYHKPGTYFEYSQRVPDLLAYVVERAVGEDLQDYAQRKLFGPIGISRNSYFWLRDRSGHTYGYAWLFHSPKNLARLGLLALNNGEWNGKTIVPASYIKQAAKPTKTNPCHGHLFWTNAGKPCTGANITTAQTFHRHAIPSAPHDLFAMVGALHQNNFMIPSLDLLVTWTGTFGDREPNLSALLSAAPADLYNNFFSLLMRAVKDSDVPKQGFLKPDALDLDVNPLNYFNPALLLSNIITSPKCNVLVCNGEIPTKGLLKNLQDLAILV